MVAGGSIAVAIEITILTVVAVLGFLLRSDPDTLAVLALLVHGPDFFSKMHLTGHLGKGRCDTVV